MRIFATLLLCLSLAGCALPRPDATKPEDLVPLLEPDVTLPVPAPQASSFAPRSTTGSLLERAADGGILEIGLSDAPLLIVFTNYACDYCERFMRETLPGVERDYVDPGRLRVQIVPVPFEKYSNSTLEASALVCATARARGRQMHEKLLGLSKHDRASVLPLAATLKMTQKDFGACLDSQATKDALAVQQALVEGKGVTLVPAFALASARSVGLASEADFRGWLEEALSGGM